MATLKAQIRGYLNKTPALKKILSRIIFVRGGYNRLSWAYYHIYFFFVNAQFSFGKPRDTIKKNPIVKSAVFLLPKYFTGETICEAMEEFVLSFKELHPDILVERIYLDEGEFINNKESYIKRIIAVNPSHFIYLYGPNPDFYLATRQLITLLRKIDGYKIIMATDSISLPCSYFLSKIKKYADMIVGIDAPLRFKSRSVKLIGPSMTAISRYSFDRFIKPNLSIPKDVDILIAGSQYRKRLAIAEFLQENRIKVTMLGGKYGNDRIPYDKYYLTSCRAKIRVVSLFTHDELHVHLKGHIAEAAAAASLLFVDSPYPASVFFEEGKEFISFASLEDLLKKIKWYLNNEEERVKISNAAHNRWVENYSGGKIWESILK